MPNQNELIPENVGQHSNLTRREFLIGAASATASVPSLASNAEKTATLPTVPLATANAKRAAVAALERASFESGPQMGHKQERRPVLAAVG